jgi:hypothetical protein
MVITAAAVVATVIPGGVSGEAVDIPIEAHLGYTCALAVTDIVAVTTATIVVAVAVAVSASKTATALTSSRSTVSGLARRWQQPTGLHALPR